MSTRKGKGLTSGVPTSARIYDAETDVAPTLQSQKSKNRGGSSGPMIVTNSSAAPSSQESAEWISASPGPDSAMPSSPRSNPSGEQSSQPASPESPSTPTCETCPSAGAESRGESPAQAIAFQARYFTRENKTGGKPSPTVNLTAGAQNGDSQPLVALAFNPYNQTAASVTHTLQGGIGDAIPLASTSSPSGAPARTSPSPESGEDSTATALASSGKRCESQEMGLFDPEPYSWRTWRGSCRAITDGTSPSSWTRWPSAGIGGATEFSTRSTSRCPSGASACSCAPSLTTILEPNASPRYSLSAKAATGILRRATRRGRTLPPALEQALRAVAETTP